MSNYNRRSPFKLISERSGIEIRVGSSVTTFRGEKGTLTMLVPPHKPSSSGHVIVKLDHGEHQFYPSVIGARYVEDKS